MNGRDARRIRIALTIGATAILAAVHAGFAPSALIDAEGWASFRELLAGFTSPDLSASFLQRIRDLAIESFFIGALGTGLAIVLAIGLALLAARSPDLEDDPGARPGRIWMRRAFRAAARGILAFFRSVPEIIWAFLFVRIFGLGPGAAVFAIAITFSGIIGKLFAEIIEAAAPGPARHLRAAGAGPIAVFLYGILPLVRRQWVGYALFRLECAIRSASILGVVGAGGLGLEIDLSMRYFQYDKLATALLAVLAYVIVLELVSALLRNLRPAWPTLFFAFSAALALLFLDIPWAEMASGESMRQAMLFVTGFADPTRDASFLLSALRLIGVTVAMAWIATVLAAMVAFVLAPLAATTFTIRGYLEDAPRSRGVTRWLALGLLIPARLSLQVSRALPELVWALLFIVWVGPGVTAGVLALTVHTVGVLGRLYGDVFEESEPEPPRMLEAMGAMPLGRYLYGVLPQVLPRMLAFTLFRFEVNVRAAAMVGFVGAGGLGDALHTAISLFHMRDLAALLVLTLLVIVLVDSIGDVLRQRLLREGPSTPKVQALVYA